MHIEGQIVDIVRREIYPGRLIISDGLIVSVVRLESAPDHYLLPGFIDSHLHVESSMVLPGRFAEKAVAHGTVAVVADPHEIANVLGVEGVDYMINDSRTVPLRFFFGAPSCVPATPFDHSGATIDADDVGALLSREDILFLSEMMNFPGVINGDPDVIAKLEYAKKLGKPIDGHAPGLVGDQLKRYASYGVSTDHESVTIDEAKEKIELGFYIQIREGSAARNFDTLHPLIKEFPDRIMFCTDDCHPNDLNRGHINSIAAKSLNLGYSLFDVLNAACATPAKHYGFEAGLLQEGNRADFIVVDDLNSMSVMETWIDGVVVYSNGSHQWERDKVNVVNNFLKRNILNEDIVVKSESETSVVRVIEAIDGELVTKGVDVKLKSEGGALQSDSENDILKIVLVNRYVDKTPSVGFIKGFGIKNGAIAGSVAHDSHNIIAVGSSDHYIIEAVNSLMRCGGGIIAVSDNFSEVLELPVAGIMSVEPVDIVAKRYEELDRLAKEMGSKLKAPYMTLSFMALLVIPELKIGDDGLFNVDEFKYISLVK